MGTKEPADESEAEIAAYLKQHKFEFADHSFLFADALRDSLSTPLHAMELWKLEHGTPPSGMQIRIYDNAGTFVNGYAQCYGPYERLPILQTKEFRFFRHIPNNEALLFSNEPDLWEISPSQKEQILQAIPSNNYTFVIYWNIWSNHYSKVMLKAAKRYLERYETDAFNIQVILVNTARDVPGKQE